LTGLAAEALGLQAQLIQLPGKILALAARLAQIEVPENHTTKCLRHGPHPPLNRRHDIQGAVPDQGNIDPAAKLIGQQENLRE
jgi:hypothetical protein